MAYIKKFQKGDRIYSMNSLDMELEANRWIYWNHKPQHPGWIMSMQYNCLRSAIKKGILYKTKEAQCQQQSK